MAYAIVQDGVIMGLGASELAAEHDAEEISLSGGLYQLDSTATCVHASEEALRDWQENGPDASIYINETGEVRSGREASNDAEGELWVVLVDGVRRPQDPSFFVSSDDAERRAISMWKQHTGLRTLQRGRLSLRTLHRGRLSAVPKVKADVPDSTGASVPSGPIPSSRPEVLTIEEQAAIRAWADEEGPRWKAALRLAWETGNYGGSEHDAALQRIRNRLGPSWLVKFRLPVDPSEETKGYHCWVVTSRKPHRTRGWLATTRAEAVSQVKNAVRNNRTEGGVESRDPERPFEATFSVVRGKLVTTKCTD